MHVRRSICGSLISSVDGHLHSARYTQLIENTKNIVLDGVLTDLQFTADLTIAEALDEPSDHILFTSGK